MPTDVAFRDETGRAVTLGSYFGQEPVIMLMTYYTCPMLCPLLLDGLVRSLRGISFDVGKEFTVLTVSIDPRDTPTIAAARKELYVQRYGRPGAADGWHFLMNVLRVAGAATVVVLGSFVFVMFRRDRRAALAVREAR